LQKDGECSKGCDEDKNQKEYERKRSKEKKTQETLSEEVDEDDQK